MALGLASTGANVMITAARNQQELDAVQQAAANEQAGAIHTMLADAASEEDSLRVVDRTIREFVSVHILVNNEHAAFPELSRGAILAAFSAPRGVLTINRLASRCLERSHLCCRVLFVSGDASVTDQHCANLSPTFLLKQPPNGENTGNGSRLRKQTFL